MRDTNKLIDRRYHLGEQLGEGGMGRVFRATHLIDHQVLALKLMTAEQDARLDPTMGSRNADNIEKRLALAREFQTLASLHHPNVIRVQSYGFDEQQGPYFTMELLEGALDIVQAAQGADPLARLQLIVQLLRALAYIHRRGVIHRDLKPGNVLVVRGEIRLLDFGIASNGAATDQLAGTLQYLAPELFFGVDPSVRSDLYAVGLILHQVVTGRLPGSQTSSGDGTLGDSGLNVTHDDGTRTVSLPLSAPGRNTDRDNLSRFSMTAALEKLTDNNNDAGALPNLEIDIPGELGDLTRKLLNPDPSGRYQDADAVIRAISASIGVEIPIETEQTRESFLRATVMIGRDHELAQLRRMLRESQHGSGAAVLVGGESGVGKSRLLDEMRTLALVHGYWVAVGQSVTDGATYYHEWLPLIRALCLSVDVTDQEASVLKPMIPDVSVLLERAVPDPATVKPEEMQTRLAGVLRALLGKLAHPLLIILEDIHWARSETLQLLNDVASALSKMPIVLVATYRSDEAPDLPAKLPGISSLQLTRLSQDNIAQLAQNMLGEVGSNPELVAYLTRQTEGNVFFLIEVLRALAEDVGGLRLIGQGALPEALLTSGIERIIEHRIGQVDPQYRPVLDLAATLGRQLDLKILERAYPSVSLRTLLLQCANAAVLDSQGADWRFAHDKLRETILRRLSSDELVRLHAQVAELLELTYTGEDRDRIAAQLAFHFRRGKQPARALDCYVLAGDRAGRLGLQLEARGLYREALDVLAELPDEAQWRGKRIDVLLKLMRSSLLAESLETQLKRGEEIQALLNSLGDLADLGRADKLRQLRLDYYLGQAYYYRGQPAEAIRRYERLALMAQEHGDAELKALPAAVTGIALVFQGYAGRARQILAPAIDPLRELGQHFELVRSRECLGLSRVFMGDYVQGLQEIRSAEARAQELEQQQLLFIAKLLIGIAHHAAMDWPAVIELLTPTASALDKAGEKAYGVVAWSFLAWCEAQLGNHDTAKEHRSKAKTLVAAMGGRTIAGDWYIASDAEMAMLAGNYEEAASLARAVVESSSAASLIRSWGIGERALGAALAHLGAEPLTVEQHMANAVRAFGLGQLELDIAQTHVMWSQCCRLRGDNEQAAHHLEEGKRRFVLGGCDAALTQIAQLAAMS